MVVGLVLGPKPGLKGSASRVLSGNDCRSAGSFLTYAFGRVAKWPLMPRASKRRQPNNGNLPRARQNHARSRCESASAPKDQVSHPFVAAKLLMGLAKTYDHEASREDTEAGIRAQNDRAIPVETDEVERTINRLEAVATIGIDIGKNTCPIQPHSWLGATESGAFHATHRSRRGPSH